MMGYTGIEEGEGCKGRRLGEVSLRDNEDVDEG